MTWSRIDKLRLITGQSLAKIASELGVGVSMLMMVKTGKRNLSAKATYRLEQAERAAGITSPVPSVVEVLKRDRTSTPEDRDFNRAENARFMATSLQEDLLDILSKTSSREMRELLVKTTTTLDLIIKTLKPLT